MQKGDVVVFVGFDGTEHAAFVAGGDLAGGTLDLFVMHNSAIDDDKYAAAAGIQYRAKVAQGDAPEQWKTRG